MRTGDIDMTGDVWIYKPWTHKNEHHGQLRQVAIGPRAQAILKPFLKPDQPLAYVFSPREAWAAVRAERARQRKTRRTPSQLARRPKPKPKRQPGERCDKNAYARAVARACEKAGVSPWHPHQLRHNCATKVQGRRETSVPLDSTFPPDRDVAQVAGRDHAMRRERMRVRKRSASLFPYPKKWVTRSDEKEEKFRVAGDPAKAVAARLVWSSWSPGYMNGIYVNGKKVFDREGPR